MKYAIAIAAGLATIAAAAIYVYTRDEEAAPTQAEESVEPEGTEREQAAENTAV